MRMPDVSEYFRGKGTGRASGPEKPKKGIGTGFRNFGRKLLLLLLAFFLLQAVFSSVYRITEQEQGVVTRFGKVLDVKTAGMYFRIPMVDRVTKVRTTTSGLPIGYRLENEAAGENGQASTLSEESLMITSDFNFVNTDFYIEYRVSDAVKYLYRSSAPESMLKNLAQAAIRATVSNYKVDDVMTTGKSQIQAEVRETLTRALTEADIGLEVVNLSIQDVEPPTSEVMAAFKSVENAKQGSETAINNANKYQSEQLPAAEASADKIIQSAEAKKAARISEADGQVARFNAMYEEYRLNPLITKQRMFYETMEELLPELKVIISDGGTETMLPLAPFSGAPQGTSERGTAAYGQQDTVTEATEEEERQG